MLYTVDDVSHYLDPRRFKQGADLLLSGPRVVPDVQRGGEVVTGVVSPGGNNPLRVYVRISRTRAGVTIQGECTCKRGEACEHVAAVLIQALAEDMSAYEPRPSRAGWRVPDTGARGSGDERLLYRLQPSAWGFAIDVVVAQRQPRGGYLDSRTLEPARVLGRKTLPRFVTEEDVDVLGLLNPLRRFMGTELRVLEGPGAGRVLRKVLATGRCQLIDRDESEPLRLGEARVLGFAWRTDEAGYQHLDVDTDPPAGRLIVLHDVWYLDRSAQVCGPIDGAVQGDSLKALLGLPPVDPHEVGKLQRSIAARWPDLALPPLREYVFRKAPRVVPVPRLCFTTRSTGFLQPDFAFNPYYELDKLDNGDDAAATGLGPYKRIERFEDFDAELDFDEGAILTFDYGGIVLTVDGPDTVLVDEHVVQVRRNGRSERDAIKRLETIGLEMQPCWLGEDDLTVFAPGPQCTGSSAEFWLDLQIDGAPQLAADGWQISYDEFRFRVESITRWTFDLERADHSDWFELGVGVEVAGEHVDLLPALLEALRGPQVRKGRRVGPTAEFMLMPVTNAQHEACLLRVPTERVEALLQILLELFDGTTARDGTRVPVNHLHLARLSALDAMDDRAPPQWLGDEQGRVLIERLRQVDGIPDVASPPGLRAELRGYQRRGLAWLQFLAEYRFAGILADDMGLGKTVQALAHVLTERSAGRADRPSLVIAPTSLMFNWRHEAEQFAPELKVLVLHGPNRKQHFDRIADADLVITTYPLLARDQAVLTAQPYHVLILDEAQVIKNPRANASRIVRTLDARHRLCLTGTPMENHLGELWSLFDFLLPGLLGDRRTFAREFRNPIEKHGDDVAAARLARRVRPFLLRRTKQEVAAELPQKSEFVQRVALEGRQGDLYETVRLTMHERVREEIARQGLARSHIIVLDALLKLRQVCCDPRLMDSARAHSAGDSAKLAALMDMLPAMLEEGRRILLFSQFTSMLALIEEALDTAGINYVTLTGQTRNREDVVRQFQDGAVPLFLISLKAGGTGLNLTTADTVVHYDPWWNPAVERQATDRAHRIGQDKAVFVYKLICEGTVEEKILALQQRKQALADSLFEGGGNAEPQWSSEDLDALFGALPASGRVNAESP